MGWSKRYEEYFGKLKLKDKGDEVTKSHFGQQREPEIPRGGRETCDEEREGEREGRVHSFVWVS